MIESKYKIPEQIKLKTHKNEDQRRFCVVPLKAFLNRKVSGENLRVLAVLASYCNKGGYSFVSLQRIADDLGCTQQNISKHLKRLEKAGIISSVQNSWPALKGNTRRIIYDEKIKDDDLKEHQFLNADISAIRKHTKLINEIDKTIQPLEVVRSEDKRMDDITSLFIYITSDSDLLKLEKLINSGYSIESLKTRLAQGIQVSEL
jgi:biotin operon repressor